MIALLSGPAAVVAGGRGATAHEPGLITAVIAVAVMVAVAAVGTGIANSFNSLSNYL